MLDTTPVDGKVVYSEGIHAGYRAWLRQQAAGGAAPLLPSGLGLGYPTFELGTAHAPQSVPAGQDIVVHVPVRNTGWQAERGWFRLLVGRHAADDFQPLEVEVR